MKLLGIGDYFDGKQVTEIGPFGIRTAGNNVFSFDYVESHLYLIGKKSTKPVRKRNRKKRK